MISQHILKLSYIQFFVYTPLNVKTVLFQTIQCSMSTKLNDSTYSSVSLTIQFDISNLFTHSQMIEQFYFKQIRSA